MREPLNANVQPPMIHDVPQFRPRTDAALALEDGRIFRGTGFGAHGIGEGEAVFTTTMTGYQEVCTDPSFRRQLVCMTYPLIGNYGVNRDDDQSRRPWIAGLIVREHCDDPSNWRSIGTVDSYLRDHGIPGISGVDTRALTRHIRSVGDIRAALVHDAERLSDDELIALARQSKLPGDLDVVDEVVADQPVTIGPESGPHVVVLDCGVKRNIVTSLVDRGARVTVVPYGTPFRDIQALHPDGVIVSPGPGDPANLDEGLDVVRDVLASGIPYFGICLGHQLLARAIGAGTDKLKFGHRGGNHPVLDLRNGRVSITAQNHGYRVQEQTLPEDSDWRVALLNLNDRSVEGLTHRTRPVISVQFHPEASPGPLDNGYLFDDFLAMMSSQSATGAAEGAH